MADNRLIQIDKGQNRIPSFGVKAFAIAVGVCVLLCVVFAACSTSNLRTSFELELEGQINPNNAPLASLERLPGIGVALAGAIVDYRENFSDKDGRAAFENTDDLQKVKGIGPKKAEGTKEWLKFE